MIDGEVKRRDDQRLEYIRMTALTEGTPASSRPMSRVARKLAESSEEIPATAGLSLPALQGDAGGQQCQYRRIFYSFVVIFLTGTRLCPTL